MISEQVLNFNMMDVYTCNIIFKLHNNKQELNTWTLLCLFYLIVWNNATQ